jgi:ribosomal-protein-alanine N-acetyltransferase
VSTTLETERLVLRPWTADDVGLLLRLSKDPRVTRYIGAGDVWPAQKALDVSDRAVTHWHEHQFGWRVAVSKLTGEEIGFVALDLTRPDTEGVSPGEHEIGWWLDPSYWGHGYTAEAAISVRDDAFATLDPPFLVARVRPENLGSVGVTRKLGMTLAYEVTSTAGFTIAVYRLEPTSGPSTADTPSLR